MKKMITAAVCALASSLGLAETVTLSPIADATLFDGLDQNNAHGAGPHVFVGVTRDAYARRALVQFDLSQIPGNAVISGASLTLTVTRHLIGEPLVTVHRLTSEWGEGPTNAGEPGGQGAPALAGDATWVFRFFGTDNSWNNPGGDFEGAPSAQTVVTGFGTFTWSGPGLVADVQAWVSGNEPNFGWLLRGGEDSTFNAKQFGSRENADPAVRPVLVVEYTVAPACEPDVTQDGNVDQDDIFCLAQVVAGDPSCSSLDPDFNRDGNVDQDDIDALAQVVAGQPCP
ncbi:MAG: DNRLRE domain-containing protein [Planctomycetota bacterium]|nr:DNRLRE domain-containing protein [Planctomycetota bacterium]